MKKSSLGLSGPPTTLQRKELHASVSDPALDSMNFLNEIVSRYPNAISFAPGRPHEGFFDVEQIFAHIRTYLNYLVTQGNSPTQIRGTLFQYGPTAGIIRDLITRSLLDDEGIDVPADSIVVTVGCQEAMLLVLRALIADPRDVFLVSSPCYVGITGAAKMLDIDVTEVAEREQGFHCADLDRSIRTELERGRRPRAFYVVPDHSNPAGTTMGMEARYQLLELAAQYDLLIVEDSPYRMVSPAPHLPTLKSLDRNRRVIHMGSFSKTAFPGVRVGFVVADQFVIDDTGRTNLLADDLAKIKSMVTVNTSAISQAIIAGILLSCQGQLSQFNMESAIYYSDAMQKTLEQLDSRFPSERRAKSGITWNKPDGGFFLTMRVPFIAGNEALVRSAEDFGVIWTPMSYFYSHGGGEHSLRLSVSYLPQEEIPEGINRLDRFIQAESRRDH
jgi:(S)-3,5-dihydroxyphenylglycine transaminase